MGVFLSTPLFLPVLTMAVPVSYSSMGYFQSSMPHPRYAWHDDQMSGEPPAGQQDVIVILAFISGASFISLIIILAVFALCRWRSLPHDDDNTSNHSIIYNIEQDNVSISPLV